MKEEPGIKKIKSEQDTKEQLLRIQSDEYWKLKDLLNKELYKDQIAKDLLLENGQSITVTGRDNVCFLLGINCIYCVSLKSSFTPIPIFKKKLNRIENNYCKDIGLGFHILHNISKQNVFQCKKANKLMYVNELF